jgi:hypothetical protein
MSFCSLGRPKGRQKVEEVWEAGAPHPIWFYEFPGFMSCLGSLLGCNISRCPAAEAVRLPVLTGTSSLGTGLASVSGRVE